MLNGMTGNWWGGGGGGTNLGFPEVAVLLSSSTPVSGDTVTVSGGVTMDSNVARLRVIMNRYTDAGVQIGDSLIDDTFSVVSGVQYSWEDMLGEPLEFDVSTSRGEYLTVSLGATDYSIPNTPIDKFKYRVMPAVALVPSGVEYLRSWVSEDIT